MKKEYDLSKMKAQKNPYARKRKAVGINLSHEVIDYFKKLSEETGVAYQKLIDLYLLDCVKNKKKLSMKWTGQLEALILIERKEVNRVAIKLLFF